MDEGYHSIAPLTKPLHHHRPLFPSKQSSPLPLYYSLAPSDSNMRPTRCHVGGATSTTTTTTKNRLYDTYTLVWLEGQETDIVAMSSSLRTHGWGHPIIFSHLGVKCFKTYWRHTVRTEDTNTNILNGMWGNHRLLTLKSPRKSHPKHLIFHKPLLAASNNRLLTFSHLISSTVLLQSWQKFHPSRLSIFESYHINSRRNELSATSYLSRFISHDIIISMMLLCTM